jgi:hypothetical protein
MWLRESKETKTEREGVSQFIIDHLGATVSQALTFADGYDAFKKGDYRTAVEKIAPAFVRNWMFMDKQATEGAKDSKGAMLRNKNEITQGELMWRAVGFNSDKLADIQTNNFKVIGMQQKIENQRTELLLTLDIHFRKKDLKQYKNTMAEITKFNTKYPWETTRIDGEDIADALEARAERRGSSWRGVNITEKNAPYAIEALAKSRKDAKKE